MTNDRMVEKLYYWKPIYRRLVGRPEIGWENDIKGDLRIRGVNNWTKCTQDRVKWKEVVQKARTFKQYNCSAWIRRRWIILCSFVLTSSWGRPFTAWRLPEEGHLQLNHVRGSMFMDSCNIILASVAVCNWLLLWDDRHTETSLLFLSAAYVELSSGFIVSLLDLRTLYRLQMWHEGGAEGVVLGVTKVANFEVDLV
jgi:hypothetical protein